MQPAVIADNNNKADGPDIVQSGGRCCCTAAPLLSGHLPSHSDAVQKQSSHHMLPETSPHKLDGAGERDMSAAPVAPTSSAGAVDHYADDGTVDVVDGDAATPLPSGPPTAARAAGGDRRQQLPRQCRSLELPGHAVDEATHTLPRQKSARSKMLTRSHAMREEASPPPPEHGGDVPPRYSNRPRRVTSLEGRTSPYLSRESSCEVYTDSKGVDVEQFLIEALNANPKDQLHLLKYEQEMLNFIKDRCRTDYKFPPQSSYQRMLVHRAAVYFGLDHNVDPTGTQVIVTKTERTRVPDLRFRDLLREDGDEPKRVLRRDGLGSQDSRDGESLEGSRGSWMEGRRAAMSNKSHSVDQPPRYARLNKGDSLETAVTNSNSLRLPPSSSTAAASGPQDASMRAPCVSKAHSFGGYTGAASAGRAEMVGCPANSNGRLSKQDSSGSNASRLSPSSGYKTASVSQATLDSTPSPTSQLQEGQPVLWAVSNLDDIPAGSVIIDPVSGQPYLNPDGTVYRYDPTNPPRLPYAPLPPPLYHPHDAAAAAAAAGSPPLAAYPAAPHQYLPAMAPPPPLPQLHPGHQLQQTAYMPSQHQQSAAGYYTSPTAAGAAQLMAQNQMRMPQQLQNGVAVSGAVTSDKSAAAIATSLMSDLNQQMAAGLALTAAPPGVEHINSPDMLLHQQQQQYLLAYRPLHPQQAGAGSQSGASSSGPPGHHHPFQQHQQQAMYCLSAPQTLPVRYMYQRIAAQEQPYMSVYTGGVPTATSPDGSGYYMSAATPGSGQSATTALYPIPSTPGSGQSTATALYPIPSYYAAQPPTAQQAAAAAAYTQLSSSRGNPSEQQVAQQMMGYATAGQYSASMAAGAGGPMPPSAAAGVQRMRGDPTSAAAIEEHQLQLQQPLVLHQQQAYQRPMTLNHMRLVTPLRAQMCSSPQQHQYPLSAASMSMGGGRQSGGGRARRSRTRSRPASDSSGAGVNGHGSAPAGMGTAARPPATGTPTDADSNGCVLEVEGALGGLRRSELECLLDAVSGAGGRLDVLPALSGPDSVLGPEHQVRAVFDTPGDAEMALASLRSGRLKLRRSVDAN